MNNMSIFWRIIMVIAFGLTSVDVSAKDYAPNDSLTESQIESMRAIVALELNIISLEGENIGNKSLDELKKKDSSTMTVSNIKEAVKGMDANVKLCEEISNLSPKSTKAKEAVDFFTQDIFETPSNKSIKKFIDKRENSGMSKESVKSKVSSAIKNQFNIEPEKNNENKVEQENKETNQNHGFLTYLFVILTILFAVIFLFFYKKWRDTNLALNKKRSEFRTLKKEMQFIMSELELVKTELSSKNTELASVKKELVLTKMDLARMKSASNTGLRTDITSTTVHPAKKRVIYADYIDNVYFNSISERFIPGDNLYRITLDDDNFGSFEFINDPENISIAKNSRTTYIDRGCLIENDSDYSYDYQSIITVERGRTSCEGGKWHIDKKAKVRLE